jgi:FAD/FMN-containing dehydrogenase
MSRTGSSALADRAVEVPARFRGDFVFPDQPAYASASAIWNTRVGGRPAAVARCAGPADVRAALQLAREQGLVISVRGGGHSVTGNSSNDGGLIIDLTALRNVQVDPATATAWVGGGVLAGDVLLEALQFGLAPVTGISGVVGLTGLSMGVGEGFLTKHGFAADNVLELEVVTAAGEIVRVSAEEHPDLFWAMRGAGANFGVVTGMRIRLHPAPARAVGGQLVFGERDLLPVTRHLWEVMEHGSEDFNPYPMYRLGETGQPELAILPGHLGPADVAERELAELRACGTVIRDETSVMSYADLIFGNNAAPEIAALPHRSVWDLRRFEFGADPERQIELLLDVVRSWRPGGAPMRYINPWRTVPRPAPTPPSAVPRLPGISVFIASWIWTDAAQDEAELGWFHDTVEAFASSGLVSEPTNAMNHVSFPTERRIRDLYGSDYERLTGIKALYDPDNIFHGNYNIPPQPGPEEAHV